MNLSRALICGRSRGTLFPVGVVTTTASENDAVCVHTTTDERNDPNCADLAALQHASSRRNSEVGIPSESTYLGAFDWNLTLSTALSDCNFNSKLRNYSQYRMGVIQG